jgi:hypothetical protein
MVCLWSAYGLPMVCPLNFNEADCKKHRKTQT